MSNKIMPRGSLPPVQRANLADFGLATQAAPKPDSAASAAHQKAAEEAARHAALAKAREQGFHEGLNAGRQEMQQELVRQQAEFKLLATNLDLFCKDLDTRLSDEVLAMSLELTKLIVRQAVRVNPELIIPVLREAVASLPGVGADTVLFLHPDDAALLRNAQSPEIGSLANMKIVDDAQLERGGCRIETGTTEVDATLETRWRRVMAALGRDDAWLPAAG